MGWLLVFTLWTHAFAADCQGQRTLNNDTVADVPLNILTLGQWSARRTVNEDSAEMRQAIRTCQWQEENVSRCERCQSDERPAWDDEAEIGYGRTGVVRMLRAAGASFGSAVDAFNGYTSGNINEMLAELPRATQQLSQSFPEFPQCAEKLAAIANTCSHGKFDLTTWRSSLGCLGSAQFPDLESCLAQKCPVEIPPQLKAKCEVLIPFKGRLSASIVRHNSLLAGLYIIKHENQSQALPGETPAQRVTRRTINHVQDYLSANNSFPDRVDRVMEAFERGGTNCYGFSLVIKSALAYAAANQGVEVDIIKMTTPAHAWNRIRLQNPPMEFDIDGVTYDTGPANSSYAKSEFFPLPARSLRERPHCPTVLDAQCQVQVSSDGREQTGERGGDGGRSGSSTTRGATAQ